MAEPAHELDLELDVS